MEIQDNCSALLAVGKDVHITPEKIVIVSYFLECRFEVGGKSGNNL